MDGTTVVFLADDDATSAAYHRLAEWNWSSSLVAPDFALIHESIFDYFNDLGVKGLLKLVSKGIRGFPRPWLPHGSGDVTALFQAG